MKYSGLINRCVRLRILIFAGLALAAASLPGCGKNSKGLTVAGSTSVQPVMELIADSFRKHRPDQIIDVEGGGSSAGIMAALTGTAQLGMSSRRLKEDEPNEKTLTAITIAFDAIAVIVHPDNPVVKLDLEQLRGLFSGQYRSWKDVGGSDRPVHLIVREEGSGTRSAFEEMVMKPSGDGGREEAVDAYALVQDSTGGVREVLRGDPDAIGFISLGAVTAQVKMLVIDGVKADFETVRNKKYRLTRPFLLVSKGEPTGIAREFVDYILGSDGAKIMHDEGLVSAGR
ncbi:MAG: phosphate ABC transporter substrate-binding protein [Candidatus Riflebacteria bacterium]|nr:phosphate ABC transporter substrate-binding protein [Candidatus Riflebacteria bacterium]